MVVALGHRHRLVAGVVVDLLDRDAEVEHSCDKGMAHVMGAYMAEAGFFARQGKAFANRSIGDDSVPSGASVFAHLAPAVVVGVGAHIEDIRPDQPEHHAATYQQTAGAITGFYEFSPDVKGVDNGEVENEVEAPAVNGQPDLELVET